MHHRWKTITSVLTRHVRHYQRGLPVLTCTCAHVCMNVCMVVRVSSCIVHVRFSTSESAGVQQSRASACIHITLSRICTLSERYKNSYDVEFPGSVVQSTMTVILSTFLPVHEPLPSRRRTSKFLIELSGSPKPVHHAISEELLGEYITACQQKTSNGKIKLEVLNIHSND